MLQSSSLEIPNKDLKKRIIEISFKNKLSHIGSCITMVDLLEYVYTTKQENDVVILSAGHTGLALYVVLEKYYGFDAEELFHLHGVHPNKDEEHRIFCSSGSLGHGVGIAVGVAIADKNRDVYCLTSDGEISEGSVYEAVQFGKELKNLHILCNHNGYSAYKETEPISILPKINVIHTKPELDFLYGLQGHYIVMNKEQYKKALEVYS